jgi:3-oxoacyl-[acyl-carrier-protein] synthase-3
MVDTSDEWIMSRVGIKERRILKQNGLGTSFMGEQAVKKLLAATHTAPEEIDLLICATVSPDMLFPATANIISDKCGILNAWGYDINAGCCGFLYSFYTVANFIESGRYKKAILVCGERMSGMTDYQDRNTCPLFGDAAAAVLVEPTEDKTVGVIDGVFHVESHVDYLLMRAGGSVNPASHETVDAGDHFVYQDGRNVYKHAVTNMLESSIEVLERNGMTMADVDWFIPHQANLRIIEAVAGRAGVDSSKVLVNIEHYGNSSAASIPLCLDEYKGKIKKGDKIVLTAFGAGFTWGAMYVIWDI